MKCANMNKYKITLYNENQYMKKELIGTPIAASTTSKHYNQVPGCHSCSHDFKCNDSLKVNDPRIKIISFYGDEIRFILYNDNTIQESNEYVGKTLHGTCDLIIP